MNNFEKWNQLKLKAKRYVKLSWPLIIIGFLTMWFTGQNKGVAYFIGIGLLILGLIFDIKGISQFNTIKKNFKYEVLKPLFEETIPGVSYDPEQGLEESVVQEIEYLKKAARFRSEDYLYGDIGSVSFKSSDVQLEERHVRKTKNGKQEYYRTYFLGRIFKFDFNKRFIGSLEVLEKQSPKSKDYQKVELESIDFNDKFDAFSTNDETAFYILTPQIMEAIIKLEERHQGDLGLLFKGQYLYISIHNKIDTFDLKLFKDFDKTMLQKFKDDLLMIQDIVNTLNLNQDIFI